MRHDPARTTPKMKLSAPDDSREAVDRCRQMYQRTLANWVCDLLELRRDGRVSPAWRPDEFEKAA